MSAIGELVMPCAKCGGADFDCHVGVSLACGAAGHDVETMTAAMSASDEVDA